MLAGALAVGLAVSGVLAWPRLAGLFGEPEGVWLLERTSSSGVDATYLAEPSDGRVVRKQRFATGEVLWPTDAAGAALPTPYVAWPAERRVFATKSEEGLEVLAMGAEGEGVEQLLTVDTPYGGAAFSYPQQQVLLVQGWYEDGQTCHLLRPDAPAKQLESSACSAAASSVVTVTTSDSGSEVVRHGLDGGSLSSAELEGEDARVVGDTRWAHSTVVTPEGSRLVVQEVDTGRVVHTSEVGQTVTVLAAAGRGHALVYALDAGEEELQLVRVLPDGSAQPLGEAEVASAVLSDDGGVAWYATGSRDSDERRVFRQEEGSGNAVQVGAGDDLTLSYVGGPFPRLLGVGRSGDGGADVYADDAEGELSLVAEDPEAVLSGYAVNPANGTLYLSLSDDEAEDEGGSRPRGMLLSLPRGAGEAATLAEGYERFDHVAPAADDGSVAFVAVEDGTSEVLVRTGGDLHELDRAPVVPSLFLDPEDELVYYSTRDDDEQEVARRVPVDASGTPEDVVEDVSWAAVPGAVGALPWSYPMGHEVQAAVDPGARACAAAGIPVVDPFTAPGQVALESGQVDVCVDVPAASSVVLTALPNDGEDLTLAITGYGDTDEYEVASDDDSGSENVPRVQATLEPGTYRITVEPYSSWDPISTGYTLKGCRGPVDAADPCEAGSGTQPA